MTGGVDTEVRYGDLFVLGDATRVFYDDRKTATAGRKDYALITDFTTSDIFSFRDDVIQLNGTREDYVLAASPIGLPSGTAIYRNKPNGEPDELIGIVQGSTNLSLEGDYFRFTEASAGEFNLSDLNGSNGFVINGINQNDISGWSVSDAGDVNGDGFDDIIIGAPFAADPNGQYSAGSSYVVFGKGGRFDASFDLSNLDGSNGFVINGINQDDNSGDEVSSAGDVNGDGFDDLIIAANSYIGLLQRYKSSSYVVFGKSGGFDASFDLSNLDGSNGFKINGFSAFDYLPVSVSDAGDVNGDGFDDLIIGDPGAENYAGSSYVVFGKGGGFDASFDLSNLDGSNGFKINGINAFGQSGDEVSSAGDVNGDGFDDLMIAGSSYVVFGKGGGFDASFDLAELDGSNGFKINGFSSGSLSSAGDVNDDGFDDLIIGAPFADPNGQYDAGSSYVVFGKDGGFDASFDLSDLDGSNGFKINGIDELDYSGWSVSDAGDVNGDGFNDLIIGAFNADPNGQFRAGESYVVFGKGGGFDASFDLSDLNGSNGFKINGINEDDFSGWSVSDAGDVNSDGFDDLIIGASGADPNGQSSAGESYVIFGRADFTAFVTDTSETLNQLLVGNTSNALMSSRQDLPFGSTTADSIFLNQHNSQLAGLLVGTEIT